MDIRRAEIIINNLVNQSGLNLLEWQWRWSKSITYGGECCWSNKTVYISKRFARINNARVIKNIVKHELCHALGGEVTMYHTGASWNFWCKMFGINTCKYIPPYAKLPRYRIKKKTR